MKRKLFLLGTLALILAGGTMWSCQKDDLMTSPEDGLVLKGGTIPFTWTDVCADQEISFTVAGSGQKQIRIWDEDESEWIQLASSGNNSNPLTHTTTLATGTYYFGYKLGNTFYPSPSAPPTDGFMIEIADCGCEESFTYETIFNENETEVEVTFTYIPEENMDDATLVFTFAQSAVVSGLENWTAAGVTRQKVMDLVACQEYSWTVTLTADCNGKGQNLVNAWTDFKVGNEWVYDEEKGQEVLITYSKKGDLDNINVYCADSE